MLGVLILESTEEGAYLESDQAFIVQLATQAAVAVVNAELYNEAQRRLREQSILYGISTRLVGNPELEGILQTVADTVGAVVQNAAAGVYVWDENTFTYIARQFAISSRPACRLPPNIREQELGSCAQRCSKPDRCACPLRRKIPASWRAAAKIAAPRFCHWW